MNDAGKCQCGCGERTPIATKTRESRQQVKGHPLRFINGHNGRLSGAPIADRLWARVDRRGPDDCWNWQGKCRPAPDGGGQFHWKQGTSAYRAAYFVTFGPIPEGLCVLHRCDNRACCNPAHLFIGTQADNSQDCLQKGRTARGRTCPSAKLSADAVKDIRRRRAAGQLLREIADAHGIGSPAVHNVLSGKTWKHV